MSPCLVTLLLSALASTAPSFEVQPLEGPRVAGQLVQLDGKQVTVETPSGRVTLPLDKVAAIAASPRPPAPAEPRAWVELIDGSVLSADEFTLGAGRAAVKLGGETIDLPVGQIAAVRFQDRPQAAAEWTRLREAKNQTDVLVTSKGDNVDYHRGTIHTVDDRQVRFEFDGETLAVKRPKIFGLIFFHADTQATAATPYTLTDATGSRWSVKSLRLNDKLEWTTGGGQTVRRDLGAVASIDLSLGKIVFLGDLVPASVVYTPLFAMAKELPERQMLLRPRSDQNIESKPLRIGGAVFPKGLWLHSRTEVVYRLSDKFSRLEATVGIDDAVRPRGQVRLVIRGDDKVLLDAPFGGTDAARPISLDLQGAGRLSILVDFGDDLDIGDHLDLGNAKLIK